jgi:hypothetical protein
MVLQVPDDRCAGVSQFCAWPFTLRKQTNQEAEENILSKGEKVTGEWRQFRNKELYDLYFLPHIIRMMKSRKLEWADHIQKCYKITTRKMQAQMEQ